MEPASRREARGRGYLALDRVQALLFSREFRKCVKQALRVGVLRFLEQVVHRGLLDDASGIHDGHVVGAFGHDAEVVRDEKDAHPRVPLQGPQEIEDLGLDGHIERSGGLVGDE